MIIKINEKKVVAVIRFILTMLILQQVWVNSHWSVALSITLMVIGIEFMVSVFKDLEDW
jgi:hypothetical protein